MSDRYDTGANPEGEFQHGSNKAVLSNKYGVTDLEEMEGLEFDALIQLEIKPRYILAIHAGHAGDYEPMKAIFSEVLALSLQESDQT